MFICWIFWIPNFQISRSQISKFPKIWPGTALGWPGPGLRRAGPGLGRAGPGASPAQAQSGNLEIWKSGKCLEINRFCIEHSECYQWGLQLPTLVEEQVDSEGKDSMDGKDSVDGEGRHSAGKN